MADDDKGGIYYDEYVASLKKEYPELVSASPGERDKATKMDMSWVLSLEEKLEDLESERFVYPNERSWGSDHFPFVVNMRQRTTVRSSYKGLLCVKSPFDLVLYHNLLWELRPKTVIELGALQGGSALWLADQLACIEPDGEVHAFERLIKSISPRAKHPQLHFHEADLKDLEKLDTDLLERLPHPWVIIDDAHVNPRETIPFFAQYMEVGDYFVLEDLLIYPSPDWIHWMSNEVAQAGFAVDTRLTDAFGYNVTTAPNAWLRKMK